MLSFFTKKKTVVVHNGQFHADDLFAAATLSLVLQNRVRIVRTRDEKTIESADYVADVGGVYDPALQRFDHHQKGGAGTHENGIPYAAFGLVWKTYGEQLCGSKEIAERIEKRLVCAIDADDNAYPIVQSLGVVSNYTLQGFLYLQRPTWKESSEMYDTSFYKLIPVAQDILLREISMTRDYIEGRDAVRAAYIAAVDKRIIELDRSYPFQEVLAEYPEPLYVLVQRATDGLWKIEGVRKNPAEFPNRKDMPASWAGLRDEALEAATGVKGSVFCHNGRWLAVAKTREAALALANLAILG